MHKTNTPVFQTGKDDLAVVPFERDIHTWMSRCYVLVVNMSHLSDRLVGPVDPQDPDREACRCAVLHSV